jgi:hypothetical protein
MDLYQMMTRLDGLRAGAPEDEGWRAWLQGLDAEGLKAVQAKAEAFSKDELGITWGGWTQDAIDSLSQAPEPFQAVSEAFRAYVLALYKASVVKGRLQALLENLFASRSRQDVP